MKLHDTLNWGLFQEIDKICGSSVNTYPFKTKAARINDAMNRYCHLAFQADGRWPFDDINQSSPPIDTLDIVSGTNRYKFGTFTEKILNLIKLEILNSDGQGVSLIPESINDLYDSFQKLYLDTANVGTPSHYCKFGDFIYLRPFPDYSETDGLLAYFNRPATRFDFVLATVTIAAPGVFTSVAHGLVLNNTIVLETDGALPTGLTADTQYYVVADGLTADAFEVSATQGGTAITTTGAQSGNHSFIKTNKEPGIVSLHHPIIARLASLPFLIENSLPQMGAIAQLIQKDELAITQFFARRSKDIKTIMRNLIPMGR